MTGHLPPLRDKAGLTFGEHLRAQRMGKVGPLPIEPPPVPVPYSPPVERTASAPVVRARQLGSHTQREAAARLRALAAQRAAE